MAVYYNELKGSHGSLTGSIISFPIEIKDIDDPVLKSEINRNASEEFVDLYSTGMSPEEITIAEVLKNEGYYNAHIGKWHLGVIEGTTPTDQGFDDSLQMLSGLYLPKNDPNVVNAKTNEAIDNMVWSASPTK